MAQNIEKTMRDIFYKVQFNKNDHPQLFKKLIKLYEKTDLDIFWECFVSCLKVPLTVSQAHPHVIRTLEFCAKFSMNFYSSSEAEQEEPMSPFLSKLFEFLLTVHKAKDKAVRFRICHFLNMLLNSMGESAFIDDNLCDKITVHMVDRLLDKSFKVRAQAVIALHRLQDPSDNQCPIIKMYLFHLSKDPSAEVRKAVLTSMGKNQKTLHAALMRTRDIDDSVRKAAYEFISKITVRSLTIEQRERLLKNGLKDRSEIVRKYVNDVLLPTWLRYYKLDYINFIHALDAGIGTEIASLALLALFKKADSQNLLEQVPIDKNTKLIPLTSLSNENILYWKCVIQHFKCLMCTEEMELILPELSGFCIYIREFIALMSSKSYEAWEKACHEFILLQLFEISKTYDLSDEVGRKNLKELIIDTLMSDHCSDKIIECIVIHLAKVIPDSNRMIDVIANVISETRLPSKESAVSEQINEERRHENNMQKTRLKVEILELEEELYHAIKEENFLQADSLKEKINALKEEIKEISQLIRSPEDMIIDETPEEKNDSKTMVKCLSVLFNALQTIRALTPTLRSLMSIILDSLNHSDDNVHILSLKTLGVYCILDKELAKKHIMIFFLQLSFEQENIEIWVITLKAIFDLTLIYGLECFDILQDSEESSINKNKSHTEKSRTLFTRQDSVCSINKQPQTEENPCNLIKILTGLLDNANQDLRTIAVEGLCKLLINQRISSNRLISRLIILYYNPVNADDDYLRQCLSTFFAYYIIRVPDAHEMLESAYLPTLRIICDAPEFSPLQEIDTYHVSTFILNLMRSYRKSGEQIFYTHNNLAFSILADILNSESEIDKDILIKSLPNLYIQIEDETSKRNLQEAIENVTLMMTNSRNRYLKYIEQFKKKLETSPEAEGEEGEGVDNMDTEEDDSEREN